ncbi:MAG: hypothetical protein Q4P08_05245 [Eubacteriales bacterium]|nr:hypothetical protein [Eubacteriales bacterium]
MRERLRLERKDYNIYRGDTVQKKYRKLIIAVGVIILLSLIAFGVLKSRHKRQTTGRLNQFTAALEAEDYDSATELYREIQAAAADTEAKPQSNSEYREVQLAMEEIVSQRVSEICEAVLRGHAPTESERNFIEGMRDISAVEIMPLIYEKSEDWLDGKISKEQWLSLIDAFQGLSNLERMVNDLRKQLPALEQAGYRFKTAKEIQAEGNWERTWQYWQDIVDDPELAIFAREYAEFRLKEYQETEYTNLLAHAADLEERQRYYSARKLIDRMHSVFPERPELQESLERLNSYLPEKLERWIDPVPVLAIRPLIARPDLAFRAESNTQHAQHNLLTTDEFRKFLATMEEQNYVLIRPSLFFNYPKSEPEIIVPRGKKPLILLLENAAYSTLNQANGTVQKLILNSNQEIQGFYKDKNRDVLDPENNFIGILEEYIAEHPQFSFDGARAILALYLREDALGYILDETMLENQNEARKKQSLMPYVMDNEDYALEQTKVRELLLALERKGYDLASAGLGTELYNRLTPTELQQELWRWQGLIDQLNLSEPVKILLFPEGGHVYSDSAALDVVLNQGYQLLIGMGPKPYNYYFDSFVHLDRQTVSPDSLAAADAWGLSEIFNGVDILDHDVRK